MARISAQWSASLASTAERPLALLLQNRLRSTTCGSKEIEIVLTDLIAHDQTARSDPAMRSTKLTRPSDRHDMLPISLVRNDLQSRREPAAEVLLRDVVHPAIQGRRKDWYEKPLAPHTLRMAGLTLVSERRERWAKSEFKPAEKVRDPDNGRDRKSK